MAKKTITDYNSMVTKTKQKYLNSKLSFNWNYAIKEEEEETFVYFMITNHHQATKVLFDKENGVLIQKDMYITDVRTMMELQATL